MNSRQERLLVLTLAAVHFIHLLDFIIMMPLGPQLMSLFSVGPEQFSLIVSAYTLSGGVSGFLSSFFMDRFDRKNALQFLFAGFVIGTVACAFCPTYLTLIVARAVTGAFGGILGGLCMTIIADTIPLHRRGRAIGIFTTAFSVASIIGVPLGLAVTERFGWHAPFLGLGVMGVITQLLIFISVPRLSAHLTEKRRPLDLIRHISFDANKLTALSLSPILMMAHFTIMPFLSTYMVTNVGFQSAELTYIYLFGGLATIVTSPLTGWLSDQMGAVHVFILTALLALVPIWLVTHLGPAPLPVALLLTTLLFVFANARMIPVMSLVTSTVEARYRGGFMSLNSSLQQLSSGLATNLAGLMLTRNTKGELVHYDQLYYLALVATLICIAIALHLRPLEEPKSSESELKSA